MNDTWFRLKECMAEAVTDVIENLAFMEVNQTDEGVPEAVNADVLASKLLVLDPCPGELRLIMPRVLANEIAIVLYSAAAEDITEQVLLDFMAELLNTIAGHMMSAMVPEECVFGLGIPEAGAEPFPENGGPSLQCNFRCDESYLSFVAAGEGLLEGKAVLPE